jgi:hypothetical protein
MVARADRSRARCNADAVTGLQSILDMLAASDDLVVFSSWAMSWMTEGERVRLLDELQELSKRRNIWLITLESAGAVNGISFDDPLPVSRPSLLGLHTFSVGTVTSKTLAVAQHHCQWVEWRDGATAALY